MKNKFLISLIGGLLLVIPFLFSSCDNDSDPIYEGYGMVSKIGDKQFSVILDDGNLLYPRESFVNISSLKDSSRLYMQFNIMEEADSCAYVRLTYADQILTKPILAYDESILDSLGNAPIKITRSWFAHGFLNFEFMFSGRANLDANHSHMVNLLQCPSENNKLVFEFRHNDFDDSKDKVYIGVVSFSLPKAIEDMKKPVEMIIRFQDSATSTRSITLTYE